MATKAVPDTTAAAARLSLWVLLWVAVLTDYYRHRHIRGRGWQLQRGINILIVVIVVKELFHLIFAATQSANWVLLAYIILSDISDAMFLALVLHVSCGYSVTRESLGWYKGKALGLPIAYGILILVVDVLLFIQAPQSFSTFIPYQDPSQYPDGDYSDYYDPYDADGYGDYGDPLQGEAGGSSWDLVIIVAAMASLLCWILGVVFVFEFVKMECTALENALERAEAEAVAPRAEGSGEPAATTTFDGMGDPDAQATEDAVAGGADGPDLMYEVKTVEDAVSHRDKSQLLKRFRAGVYTYAAVYAAVILLPAFFPEGLMPQTMLLVYNVVLWAFLGWLAWTFRLRENNPYLLVGGDGHVEGSSALDASQLDTELGVLAPGNEGESAEETMGTRLVVHTAQMHQRADDLSNFTLTDDDPGDWEVRPPEVHLDPEGEVGTPSKHIRANALSMWPKRDKPGKST